MKKLMEAELDSSAATKQAASLKETLKKLEVLCRLTASDIRTFCHHQTHLSSSMYATELAHQREALIQRLSEFNSTNRKLRTLLRDQQAKEVSELSTGAYRVRKMTFGLNRLLMLITDEE